MTFANAPQIQKKGPALGAQSPFQGIGSRLADLAGKGYAAAAEALAPKDGSPASKDDATPNQGPGPGPLEVHVTSARAMARDFIAKGVRDANALTDQVFYRVFPWLTGAKIAAKSPEANAWLTVRDKAARPELDAAKNTPTPGPTPTPTPTPGPTPAPTPDKGGDASTPQEFHGTGEKAGTSDLYLNQNNNSYEDGVEEWARGSAGKNTCNMTAVAMALVSIAGSEAVAKEAVASYLRKKGMRGDPTAKIGKNPVSLKKIINDPSLLDKVMLEDLCIAAGVALGGNFNAVTMTGTMLNVAKKSGLVSGGKAYASSERLKDPAVLARAKQLLGEGQRIIVGTKNHYVYLTAVRDDGILVHDPAGARIKVDGSSKYLWPGKASSTLGAWDNGLKSDPLRETTLRRVSHNPEVRACFEQEAAALQLKGAERTAARDAVKKAFPGTLNTGANNFYNIEELTTYNCRIRVVLEPNEKEGAETKENAAG